MGAKDAQYWWKEGTGSFKDSIDKVGDTLDKVGDTVVKSISKW